MYHAPHFRRNNSTCIRIYWFMTGISILASRCIFPVLLRWHQARHQACLQVSMSCLSGPEACVHQEFKAFVASSSFFFNADTPGPALMLRLVKADRLGASCLTGTGFLTILLIESETMLEPSSPPRSLVHTVFSYDSINLVKIRPRFWISGFCRSLGPLGHTNLNPLSLLHPFMPEPQQQLQKPDLYRIEA